MAIARVFRSGNSQAVRLPKEFRRLSDDFVQEIEDAHSSGAKALRPDGRRSLHVKRESVYH
jgi:virulence-associated protein VagC